jgi:DNA-binding transcriptional ArsR family regulator
MSLESTNARRVLDDPVVLRALAHPLRQRLHRLLLREQSCSAAYAARELGISHALASHHLRQLAKYGFAEQVPGRDRRERPWRTLSTSTTWVGAGRDDERAAAADLLEQTVAEQSISSLLAWHRRRRESDERAWDGIANLDTSLLYLTPEEAAELGARFDELCRPYIPRRHDRAERPSGAGPVELTLLMVPLPPTGTGA